MSVLYNDALPFYQDKEITVSAVLTDNGREFCGKEAQHPYELFLVLAEIEHRPGDRRSPQRTKVRSPKTNGFVERFHRTVLDEFFRVKLRTTFYESVEALQSDLDEWLRFYNCERPHLGYRNLGKRPIDTVCEYVKQQQQQQTEQADEQQTVRQEG